MTTFYDQDDDRLPREDGVDRRSTARRQADRSIIADQAETIRALEGRLIMATARADQRQEQRDKLGVQLDEAVRLLRACLNGSDFDSEDEWVGAVRAFLAGLEG